jgi:hypothetical protein
MVVSRIVRKQGEPGDGSGANDADHTSLAQSSLAAARIGPWLREENLQAMTIND